MYKFIGDESEIKWFFNHVLDNLEGDNIHSYLMCLAVRLKNLTEGERIKYSLSGREGCILREEIIKPRGKEKSWNFEQFISHLYSYECNENSLLTKANISYPQKALSVMFYCEPSNEIKVANSIIEFGSSIQKELIDATVKGSKEGINHQLNKLTSLTSKVKSIHAECTEKRYIHFDFDLRKDLIENKEAGYGAYTVIHMNAVNFFGKGNFFIIRTNGGFHVLVKINSIKNAIKAVNKAIEEEATKNKNPILAFIDCVQEDYCYTFEEEEKIKKQVFVPMPGTIMYGNYIPRILNKEDFND